MAEIDLKFMKANKRVLKAESITWGKPPKSGKKTTKKKTAKKK